tara:strand:+ start:5369 stop:5614 length:246 start_codon:yes stop_codon:yes gene_type:complete
MITVTGGKVDFNHRSKWTDFVGSMTSTTPLYVYVVTEHYLDEDFDEGFTRVLGVYRDKGFAELVPLSEDGYMLDIKKVELK